MQTQLPGVEHDNAEKEAFDFFMSYMHDSATPRDIKINVDNPLINEHVETCDICKRKLEVK